MSITYIIIGFTCLVSIVAFSDRHMFVKLQHWPYEEHRHQEYYRWLTGGLLHANGMHLLFNMLTLYFFGPTVERWFFEQYGSSGGTIFLLFYLVSIVAASSATFFKYRNSPSFASIGASGAVAAVLFASILLYPMNTIAFIFLPIPIWAFLFGILYLWYSAYEAKRGRDNIDHTAHYYGALFGFFGLAALSPGLLLDFLEQIKAGLQGF